MSGLVGSRRWYWHCCGKIESIFLPFHQENLHTSKEFGGTGLGLAISKRFCELMDGKLLVKSIKGEATTFTVLLPATSSE